MLKWLRTGAWPKLTDVLTAIRQELQSVQPIDTASIRWEKDAEGMRAYYTGRTGGGEGLAVDEGVGGADDEYNGFFTIKLKVVDGDSYVVVCDGATWDSESETSAPSILHVNNKNIFVPCTIIDENISASRYVVIEYIDGRPEICRPILVSVVPNDTDSAIYRVIGRVIVNGDSITIQQDHTTGVLYVIQPERYAGPYALSFDSEKQKLIVKAGFAWLNGSFVSVVSAELTPETGYICVCATMNEYGVWSTPVLEFAVPSATAYPVGYCDATEVPPPEPEEGEEPADPTYTINTLTPYMQPVAILFGTGDCMEELIPPEA